MHCSAVTAVGQAVMTQIRTVKDAPTSNLTAVSVKSHETPDSGPLLPVLTPEVKWRMLSPPLSLFSARHTRRSVFTRSINPPPLSVWGF